MNVHSFLKLVDHSFSYGSCIPIYEVMELGNLFNANVIDNMIRAGEPRPDSLPENEASLKFLGVVVTYDVEGALERTAEFLGAIPVVTE